MDFGNGRKMYRKDTNCLDMEPCRVLEDSKLLKIKQHRSHPLYIHHVQTLRNWKKGLYIMIVDQSGHIFGRPFHEFFEDYLFSDNLDFTEKMYISLIIRPSLTVLWPGEWAISPPLNFKQS